LMAKVEALPMSYNESGSRGTPQMMPVQPGGHAFSKYETGSIPAAGGADRKPAAAGPVYGPPEPIKPVEKPAKPAH
ncbi:MAG: hypothetical protein AAB425_12995, partial [Bdellovibrionota bacterium]